MLDVNSVKFNYGTQSNFKGIGPISFILNEGDIIALVGKSGSGKTTLLKCIYGLEDILEGTIAFKKERVLGPAYNLIPGNKNMSLVSQDFYVLENHTVAENIKDKLIGYTDAAKEQCVNKLLRLLDLVNLKNSKAKFLSTGQKQRVAIARALAIIPPLLLLDEPFSNLDNILSTKLFNFIIKEVQVNKTSVILVTHVAEEALKYATKIAILENGKIVQLGEKWNVYYKPKNTRLAGLLGQYSVIEPKDISKKSKLKIASKIVSRPDKIKLADGSTFDLEGVVEDSVFNGKCYEILVRTPNENLVLFYSSSNLKVSSKVKLDLEIF